MDIRYYVADPTGNITILAEDEGVAASERIRTAAKMMEHEPAAEQVGFIHMPESSAQAAVQDICLVMAGGEFCGNATMSAAAFAAMRTGLEPGAVREMRVRSSGAPGIRRVMIEAEAGGVYRGTVSMPKPLMISREKLFFSGEEYHLPMVDFGGITHLIVEKDLKKAEQGSRGPSRGNGKCVLACSGELRCKAELAVKAWCRSLRTESLGLMIYDGRINRLDPLVYVSGTGTLFWEKSCASGTAALGAYLASKQDGPVSLEISEPGGTLKVFADPSGELKLSGSVRFVSEGIIS